MHSDPLEVLDRARDLLDAVPDAEAREVLDAVLADLLRGRDPRAGLGLAGQEFVRLCEAHRNHHLRTAAALLNEAKRWRRSQRLAHEATVRNLAMAALETQRNS